ncbi:hypothetical protein A946_07885 [Methylacidiphilum kamchatkense Kam1]|uniref:Uncharacterized protein n=1 Tax=Methylacidiphilum kamchatkense Kam1 TaxID=1202785 RepID=A0ABR4ZVV4_9BACT|nr:hypothetical protein A946_07885 [Methylacidiphilum kamchatkense Kam1]
MKISQFLVKLLSSVSLDLGDTGQPIPNIEHTAQVEGVKKNKHPYLQLRTGGAVSKMLTYFL